MKIEIDERDLQAYELVLERNKDCPGTIKDFTDYLSSMIINELNKKLDEKGYIPKMFEGGCYES